MPPNVNTVASTDEAARLEHGKHFVEHRVHTPVTFSYPAGHAGTQPTPPGTRTLGERHAVHDAGADDEQVAQFDEHAPMTCDALQKLAKHNFGADDPCGQ